MQNRNKVPSTRIEFNCARKNALSTSLTRVKCKGSEGEKKSQACTPTSLF